MKLPHRLTWIAAALAAAVCLPPPVAAAQDQPPSMIPGAQPVSMIPGAEPVARDPQETSRYLGSVYKSEVDGFRITPPAGARLVNRNGVDLVSFVIDNKSWGGSVQRIRFDKVMSLEDFVKTTKSGIIDGKTFKGAQVLSETVQRKGNFPAVRLAFSMQADLGLVSISDVQDHSMTRPATTGRGGTDITVALLRQEIIIRTKDNEFFTLNMYAPLKDKEQATKTFEAMLTQFEFFDPVAMKAHRLQAIADGKEWLAKQSAENYAAKLINEPLFYRILINGKDVGYFRFDEGAKEPNPKTGAPIDVERDKHKGVAFHVNFRSFPDDGTVVYGQNEAFWGFSKAPDGTKIGDYDTWTNISKTRTPAPQPLNQPGRITYLTPWVQETGVLIQIDQPHQMIVTLTGDAGQRLPNGINQIIPAVAAAPLPKILEYSWPRFVDLTKPSEMTFLVYDSASRKLSNRTLIVTGQRELVKINDRDVSCYKCLDEVDPNSTTIWVDKDGRIQMMLTSDQSVMVPTTESAMTAKWATRLKDQ